jgi:dTDP-4-amino-4,6-dideoxygalactose transaminase
MTDLAAAVGSVQLSRLPDLVAARRTLAGSYRALLSGSPITLPHEPAYARSNWQSFCVRLPRAADQRSVMQFMLHRGIATRRGIMCSHLEPAWPAGSWLPGAGGLAAGEAAQRECILLPLFPGLSSDDQHLVANTLLEALAA